MLIERDVNIFFGNKRRKTRAIQVGIVFVPLIDDAVTMLWDVVGTGAKPGPLHETMTLSDGFNSYWQALQEVRRICHWDPLSIHYQIVLPGFSQIFWHQSGGQFIPKRLRMMDPLGAGFAGRVPLPQCILLRCRSSGRDHATCLTEVTRMEIFASFFPRDFRTLERRYCTIWCLILWGYSLTQHSPYIGHTHMYTYIYIYIWGRYFQ